MKRLIVFVFIAFAVNSYALELDSNQRVKIYLSGDTIIYADMKADSISLEEIQKFPVENKRLTAAAFAFPLPLGFLGFHRIYMGCKPIVPIIYVVTIGGCFGILPLIDFIVILSNKDIERFQNCDKVFMWLK